MPPKKSDAYPEGLRDVYGTCCDVKKLFTHISAQSGLSGTEGTCLYASFLLCMTLTEFGGCTAQICGGDGQADGGLIGPDGKRHGHYWIEGVSAAGVSFIADITADQFGYEPVVLMQPRAGRLRYQPGDATTVQQHVDRVAREFEPA